MRNKKNFFKWLFNIMVNIRQFISKYVLYLQHYVTQLRSLQRSKKVRGGKAQKIKAPDKCQGLKIHIDISI